MYLHATDVIHCDDFIVSWVN